MKEQFLKLIKDLVSSVKGVTYYPEGHPAREKPLFNIHEFLLKYLKENPSIRIAIVEDTLVIEDTPFFETSPNVDELYKILEEKEIGEIVIFKGITIEELKILIELLSRSQDEFKQIDIDEFLLQRGVKFIEILEKDKDLKKKSKKVYTHAKKFIVEAMNEIRLGKVPRMEIAESIIASFDRILKKDESAILALTMLSDYDNYTFNHSVNVGILSLALARELGWSNAEDIGVAGLLHDIGKTRTPLSIINKPGKLTPEEWEIMKKHPVEGAKIVQDMNKFKSEIALMVLQHHVRYDKSGYPDIKNNKLFEGTHLITISDTYDSMTTLRPYQRRFDPKEALDIMVNKLKGKALHPRYLDTFVEMLGIYPIGSCVRLKTGEIALVTSLNRENPLLPRVKVILGADGKYLKRPFEIDLNNPNEKKKREIVSLVNPTLLNIDVTRFL